LRSTGASFSCPDILFYLQALFYLGLAAPPRLDRLRFHLDYFKTVLRASITAF
jgi:hypothetical protein